MPLRNRKCARNISPAGLIRTVGHCEVLVAGNLLGPFGLRRTIGPLISRNTKQGQARRVGERGALEEYRTHNIMESYDSSQETQPEATDCQTITVPPKPREPLAQLIPLHPTAEYLYRSISLYLMKCAQEIKLILQINKIAVIHYAD